MNITYLLGAGASANCLPVINELPERLSVFTRILKKDKDIDFSLIKVKDALIQDVAWLQKEMSKHKTVDTLARKYYLKSITHPFLLRLKRTLICYFVFEQLYPNLRFIRTVNETPIPKESPDKRYDTFIASIINTQIDNLSLPDNIKIITWNYDLQFELAYQEYLNVPITELQKRIQAVPSTKYLKGELDFSIDKFSLLRLNGVAGIGELSRGTTVYDDRDSQQSLGALNTLLVLYRDFLDNWKKVSEYFKAFNFSWENTDEFGSYLYKNYPQVKKYAETIMQETDILVVVGYSFPYFNRNVDKLLFDSAKKLCKVYVQDMRADDIIELLTSSFPIFTEEVRTMTTYDIDSKLRVTIEPVKYTDQFFIPYELS